MTETLIIFSVVLLGYAFLRSRGGEGLNINAKLPPASTPEGKRERKLATAVIIIMIGAVAFLFLSQQSKGNGFSVLTPFAIGTITYFIFYIKDHKKK